MNKTKGSQEPGYDSIIPLDSLEYPGLGEYPGEYNQEIEPKFVHARVSASPGDSEGFFLCHDVELLTLDDSGHCRTPPLSPISLGSTRTSTSQFSSAFSLTSHVLGSSEAEVKSRIYMATRDLTMQSAIQELEIAALKETCDALQECAE